MEYSSIKHRSNTQFTDITGSDIGGITLKQRNINLQLGIIVTKEIGAFLFSTGLGLQSQVVSRLKSKNDIFTFKSSTNSIKRNNAYIPIQIKYPLGSFSLLVRYERTLFNRLINSNGTTKEFENDLRIGISYQFK